MMIYFCFHIFVQLPFLIIVIILSSYVITCGIQFSNCYDCTYDFELANDFGSCFSNKIKDTRTKLVSESRDNKTDVIAFDKPFDGLSLANYDPRSFDEVLKIL